MALTLTTFVAGTKAKAEEVNANFSALQTALNEKAAIDGDSRTTFAVADATADEHATNKRQLDNLSNELTKEINKTGTKFCVHSGNTTNGQGDLFSYSLLKINPKIGGTYGNLTIADYTGTQTEISSFSPGIIDLTGNSDGSYNIFITKNGELYLLNNNIYIQASRPQMVVNDIWLNTSTEPFTCIKYSGTSDDKFYDVPLGKVTINNGTITQIETFPFNQNGNNITAQTKLENGTNLAASIPNLTMPDYENGVSKNWNTVYQADKDGYLYIQSDFGSTFYICSQNADVTSNHATWITFQVSLFDSQGFGHGTFMPIPKGMYYKATYAEARTLNLTFYPCLGV